MTEKLAFELTAESAVGWVNRQGLNPCRAGLTATELAGGVSSSVVAVTGEGVGLVVKQALPRLRVGDRWEAAPERSRAEVAALRLLGELTPGAVPRVLFEDASDHVFVLELLPPAAVNWQEEIAAARVHSGLGSWAGTTLGNWHSKTAGRAELLPAFGSLASFEELRLVPFHETVMRRLPEVAGTVAQYLEELRAIRCCLVDGDYAPKNILVEPGGRSWVLDLEVAHIGNPVFDLGFFLSFVVLSAVRWPGLTAELRDLAGRFLGAYGEAGDERLAADTASVTGHTACLVLARTDGVSPAAFLDDESRLHAREVGTVLLASPERGLWSWT
jgi:5-methylthioribose kinase